MKVSVIIVNYNTAQFTINTINSIRDQTKKNEYEIIVVDNNSSDSSVQLLFALFSDEITIIVNNENLGFGKANNIGVEKAKGEFIFLLNSDTLLLNNSIEILSDFLDKNKDVGICGGNLFYEDMSPAHSFGLHLPSHKTQISDIFSITGIKKKIMKLSSEFNFSKKSMDVGYITGADMMIRKNLFEILQGFDDDFFMYYEETEFTNRTKKLGYRVVSIPEAKIIHLEGKSFKFNNTRMQMKYESMYKYYYKVYGRNSLYKAYVLVNIFLYSRAILRFNKTFLKMASINKKEYIKANEYLL